MESVELLMVEEERDLDAERRDGMEESPQHDISYHAWASWGADGLIPVMSVYARG